MLWSVPSTKSETIVSKVLSTSETLARLDRLRQAIRDLTGRADQLDRDFKTRVNRLRAQFEQARAEAQGQSAAAVAEEEAAGMTQRRQIEAAYEIRKQRITEALGTSTQRKLAEVESASGKRTFEIQRDLLEAERTRETELANNKKTYEDYNALLAHEQAVMQQIEQNAQATLGSYRALARWLVAPPDCAPLDTSAHENQLLDRLREQLAKTASKLASVRRLVLPVLFRLPLWFWIPMVPVLAFAFVPALRRFDFAAVTGSVWAIVAASLVAVVALFFLGKRLASPHARAAALALAQARNLHEVCGQKADASFKQENERIELVQTSTARMLNNLWKDIQAEAKSLRKEWVFKLEEQARWIHGAAEERFQRRLAQFEERHATQLTRLREEGASRTKQLETGFNESLAKLTAPRDDSRKTIEADWRANVLPLYGALHAAGIAAEALFPPWQTDRWQQFTLPDDFGHAAKLAELTVDVEQFCEVSLAGKGLALPGPAQFKVPLHLSVPSEASVLFETRSSGHEQIIGALNNLVLRLLTSAAPGRLTFTIFDPVGLGQNFAGIMHLADFEERLINSRIWTQAAQFEQRLADLNEHIEKVTQMYLRNEYESLTDYNAQAGRLAEKYHFLVIADFPGNFSEIAVKRLHSIAASGPRCGVHLLIHWDQRKAAPVEFVPEELRKNAICIVPKGDGFALAKANWDGMKLTLDAPPDAELATQLLQQIGKDSKDSYRVEMPFVEAAPEESELWSLDTTRELRVPVGRTGATKLQYLALGQGTRQHGLIAGKTGSGKSTLFHVLITNLALWCSPDQVEFYLVDFKKGVEFKCYATHRLPHARVVAIESDREFGLSVLQRLDEELKRRGDLFRKLGAQDIAGYKRAGGTEPMPRTLLLIDEFQELFVEDDRIAQGAALLLDRIVRQGRAFGIHVLLGSQTLGGAYTLARATIGQMVVRIALQCNEADAYLIMNEDNPAPRLLSRPGEAIYNDDGGTLQGNSPFQVVWLPDQERDRWLGKVRELADAPERAAGSLPAGSESDPGAGHRPRTGGFAAREPIVFEGNAPANVRDNVVLRALLDADALHATSAPRIFLGAPNSIKGPTEAVFRRASGSHLLIVGQRDEAALGMLAIALVSLAAQHAKHAARFLVFDSGAPDSAEAKLLEQVVRLIPHEIRLVRPADVEVSMSGLAAEHRRRTEDSGTAAPETFLLVHGLHRNKKLRFDEEASFSLDADAAGSPGLQFNKLICEGAGLGFHVLATCDTYNNVMRMLSRKALSEFEMRVLFQMSANDSATLIDSPLANNLGLHRAILFNGHEGWMETFRPYALPDEAWLEEAGRKMVRLMV